MPLSLAEAQNIILSLTFFVFIPLALVPTIYIWYKSSNPVGVKDGFTADKYYNKVSTLYRGYTKKDIKAIKAESVKLVSIKLKTLSDQKVEFPVISPNEIIEEAISNLGLSTSYKVDDNGVKNIEQYKELMIHVRDTLYSLKYTPVWDYKTETWEARVR